MAAQPHSPSPIGDLAVSLLDVAIERTRALNKKHLLQRLVYVAKVTPGILDKDDIGAYYEKLFKNLNNQNQHEESFSGLLLIYPNQIVHVVEASMVMLIELMKDLQKADQSGKELISDVKILLCSCNVSDRIYSAWNYRILKHQLQEYKNIKPMKASKLCSFLSPYTDAVKASLLLVVSLLCKLVAEALTLLVKLGDLLNKIPKATSKGVLDNLQAKAGEFLIANDMVEYLVNAESLCKPKDYLSRYTIKVPVDLVLDSELIWPLPSGLLQN